MIEDHALRFLNHGFLFRPTFGQFNNFGGFAGTGSERTVEHSRREGRDFFQSRVHELPDLFLAALTRNGSEQSISAAVETVRTRGGGAVLQFLKGGECFGGLAFQHPGNDIVAGGLGTLIIRKRAGKAFLHHLEKRDGQGDVEATPIAQTLAARCSRG